MTGYAEIELAGRTPALLKSGAQDAGFYRGVLVNRRKGGELYREEKIIRPMGDAGGRATRFISSGRDISERAKCAGGNAFRFHRRLLAGVPRRACADA